MSFKNEIGFDIKIKQDYDDDILLFSETGGFVLEIDNDNTNNVEDIFNKYNLNYQNIGKTNNSSKLIINKSINLELKKAKSLWENGLRNQLK
jgi:phosphoribosylformylglycinamidine synthase